MMGGRLGLAVPASVPARGPTPFSLPDRDGRARSSAATTPRCTLMAIELVLTAPVPEYLLRDAEALRELARRAAGAQQLIASRRNCSGYAGRVFGTDTILSRVHGASDQVSGKPGEVHSWCRRRAGARRLAIGGRRHSRTRENQRRADCSHPCDRALTALIGGTDQGLPLSPVARLDPSGARPRVRARSRQSMCCATLGRPLPSWRLSTLTRRPSP
jgi:hypothetical protein